MSTICRIDLTAASLLVCVNSTQFPCANLSVIYDASHWNWCLWNDAQLHPVFGVTRRTHRIWENANTAPIKYIPSAHSALCTNSLCFSLVSTKFHSICVATLKKGFFFCMHSYQLCISEFQNISSSFFVAGHMGRLSIKYIIPICVRNRFMCFDNWRDVYPNVVFTIYFNMEMRWMHNKISCLNTHKRTSYTYIFTAVAVTRIFSILLYIIIIALCLMCAACLYMYVKTVKTYNVFFVSIELVFVLETVFHPFPTVWRSHR